jgi:formiminotetrahydrofolate cyclodeaminase
MTDSGPLRDRTIGHYLDTLASEAPAPGGGSVAGLTGALAASLGQMVIRLSIRRAPSPEMSQTLGPLERACSALLDSARRDEAAYAGYIDASRLPRTSDEEKRTRRAAMQAAIMHATKVPFATATGAVDVLRLLVPVARFGAVHALSDVEVGAMLAHAAMKAALFNVRTNLPMIKDEAAAWDVESQTTALEAIGMQLVRQLDTILADRRSG